MTRERAHSILRLAILTLLAVLLLPSGRALAVYDSPSGRVNDFANIISPETRARLEEKLKALDNKSAIELIVVTVPDLEGRTVEDYTVELAKKWKIGKRDRNNGVIFLTAPKEKKVRIEVGYGLEGDLTDAVSSRILRTVVVPYFKKGDFNGGIYAGVDAVISVITHEPPDANLGHPPVAGRRNPGPGDTGPSLWRLAFIGIFFVIVLLLSIFNRRRRGFYGGGGFGGFGGGSSGGNDGFSGGGGDFGGGGSSDSWD